MSARPAGKIPVLSADEHIKRILDIPRPGENSLLAFYEHRMGAISTNPRLMLIPLDDHLTHRGDGIFETIKYVSGRAYQLDSHLERMRRSASAIRLEPPCSWADIRDIGLQVACAGGETSGSLRILLGRGPGGFGIDPAESPTASLYIAAYRFTPKPESWYEEGLSGFRSTIPAKQGYLAQVKNANYLPNVLMMIEAADRHMDVPFCFDEQGFLAESAVASLCLVDAHGRLVVPGSDNALPGTTVRRAVELLAGDIEHLVQPVNQDHIQAATEILMLSTGPDCVSVVSYEGLPVGQGRPGPVSFLLRQRIRADIQISGIPIPGLAGSQ